MTLLGGEPPKINTGAISPGVIRASSIRVGTIGYDDAARAEAMSRRYWTHGSGSLSITWPVTASFTVDNVSPEVVAILTGQPPGETLL